MIEERIIEWLDLGDSVQKIDIYEKKRLLIIFKYHHLILKHGIVSEIVDIFFQLLFFLQIINLAAVNIAAENDLFLKVVKYIEIIIIPHNFISSSQFYIVSSSVMWFINFMHLILTIISFVLLCKNTVIKFIFFIISIINYIVYYYLIGPIVYLALFGTLCKNNRHEILNTECYSNKKHLAFTVLNFIFGFYSLLAIQLFGLYHNQIGSIPNSNVKNRVNCDYNIYSSNAKLIVYIIVYFYMKYSKDSVIFKYIYQVYIFLSCFLLSIYTIKRVFYYNKRINTLIYFSWLFNTWFALCMLIKICFNITDTTLFILLGWVLIIIIFINKNIYSHYKVITQLDLLNEQSLVHIEKFNSTLIELYHSNNDDDKMFLVGIIKKFEDYFSTNPELNDIYNKLMNDPYLKTKLYEINQLQMLSLIYTIYNHYLDKSEIKNDIILHMCYFLINYLKNPTYAIYLISKLKTNNHSQLYHKYILTEEIKKFLIDKLVKNGFLNSLNHVQIGSVILYYQYIELFKIKIYDGTCNQIEYFEILRNNVTTGNITEKFLKIGEEILSLKKEIFILWEKIVEINPFNNESENDFMLYLKTILQDDITAKNEEKKYNLFKSSKFSEKNNIYHSMFKDDINSVLLVEGYTSNGKILYASPNFSLLYKFNGKEIINIQIDELLPNFIQPFHKDLVENILKYSNITHIYNKSLDIFLKGKNNSLYNISIYVKSVPNLMYGLVFFVLLTKIQDHEFIITLDKDFRIDGFTEMNQGNDFTLNYNKNNNYYLSSNLINHHAGIVIPEILLQICYKDNCFFVSKTNIDIKGTLHSVNNLKDIDQKINYFMGIIKKKGYLNIDEETDEGKKLLSEYNEFKRNILGRQSRTYSIFFKLDTRSFLGGKYRYHRLYISNDSLYLNEYLNMDQTVNITESEELAYKKRITDSQIVLGTFLKNDLDEDKGNKDIIHKGSKKFVNDLNKYSSKDINKAIKIKLPLNKDNKTNNDIKSEDNANNNNNKENKEENKKDKDNNAYKNKMAKINNIKNQVNIDSAGFNKLKNGIINKKDSLQITFMKYVSLVFVIITVILVIYDKSYSNKRYSNLVQYLKENLYFTHSKIISSCIYITSLNIKWLRDKYIDEYSCPHNCTIFYIRILEKCINNLKIGKDSFYTFNEDFQEIILKRRKLEILIFHTNEIQTLYYDINDNLNFIIAKGIKLTGSFERYLNYYESDKINMENLIQESYNYFKLDLESFSGEEKVTRVNEKFKTFYLTIIIGTILCFILLAIFSYFIFDLNEMEIYFLDKLINFNSPNFENYLKVLEDIKKNLKNYKNEEDENNIDDMDIELGSKNEGESKKNNSKSKADKRLLNNNKKEDGEDSNYKKTKKRGNKQNKIQQQKIKKIKIMSFYFYKENIFFAIKTSLILICFVSFFVVSFLVNNANLKSFLEFDTATTDVENLYYESFRIFLIFKSALANFQVNQKYTNNLPSGKDIQLPNFGNTLNDLSQDNIFDDENKKLLNQLYSGNLCLLLFQTDASDDYQFCKEFLSSILLKGMEQTIIQMGVMINSVIDELSLVQDGTSFNNTIYGNSTNFKKYELFMEYYLLLSYLKNEEIFNNLRIDETKHFSKLTMEILIIYLAIYIVLFILLCYIIFMYKYVYNSLFNFIAILAIKFISDDEYLYKRIIELEKKLYK